MTTPFKTKEDAIMTGLFFAGRRDLCYEKDRIKTLEDILKNPEIKVVGDKIEQFGYVHEDTLMIEFPNNKNKICRIAATKFRDGFDLWLIDPESGFAHRV